MKDMKKIILWIVLVITAGTITSCLDDNEFNYIEINDLKEDENGETIQNFDSEYSPFQGEELLLAPTFTFTIDSINPDVSYEWYINGIKTDVTTPTYRFSSDVIGIYEVTFTIVDNKTGVKFSANTRINVQSAYAKGWMILSEGADGSSQLSFVKMKIATNENGNDSIYYVGEDHDFVPGLGSGPQKLLENFNYVDYYNFGNSVVLNDEVIVMQKNKWVELNGNSFTREIYTEEEFMDGMPANCEPENAVMTYTSKCIRDKEGRLYFNTKAAINDFHAGKYMSDPLFGGQLFKEIYATNKATSKAKYFLALTKDDNSLVGIVDDGQANSTSEPYDPTMNMSSNRQNGNQVPITETDASNPQFKNISYNIINIFPHVIGESKPCNWVAILEKGGQYWFRDFTLELAYGNEKINIKADNMKVVSSSMFTNYKDAVAFPHKKFMMIANGNQLWYCPFEAGSNGTGLKLKDFPSEIASISYKDIAKYPYSGSKPEYNGHIGIGLTTGEFYIYEVIEEKDKNKVPTGIATLKQLYPNENTVDSNFGKIIDVVYKFGTLSNTISYNIN